MKKLLIPAFACAAMFTACGDDSSSANDAAESSSSVVAESSSSDWAHEPIGDYACVSAKDTASFLGYAFEGPDSAMEVIRYEYPRVDIDGVEKVCEEAKANKTKEQEVVCNSIVKISNSLKTMTFDSLKALMTEECKAGSIQNTVDFTNPDEAPENGSLSDFPGRLENAVIVCNKHPNACILRPSPLLVPVKKTSN